MTNPIGQTVLNQYRVDAFVASGGMGAVYRVLDLKRNVPLAMKVLHADLAEDPSVFKRFEREARALKKLTHPNIVPFYGLFKTGDLAFLLEQYIDGPTLKQMLRQRGAPLPVEEALIYLKALCAALGYAHAHGVVHCDVKPGNVMIDRGGNIYLTDFGVARHAESMTTTLGSAGTPAYMAPEQCRGKVVTASTDVYALGVMLYEMVTGTRPFQGSIAGTKEGSTTGEQIRFAHLHTAPPDPCQVNPALPKAFGEIILKALEKDPRVRYPTTWAMLEAACVAVGTNPHTVPDRVTVSQAPPPPPPPPRPIDRRQQQGLVIVALVVVAVAMLVAVIVATARPAATPTRITVVAIATSIPTQAPTVTPLLRPTITPIAETSDTPIPTRVLALPPTSTPAASPSPRPDGVVVHVVQAGDTLYGIAQRYGVTLDELLKLNNLDGNSIPQVGQALVVKAGRGTVVAPKPVCSSVTGPFASIWSSVQDKIGCATNSAQGIWMAEQSFQRGVMFWRQDNTQIYVLYHNGGWGMYKDTWQEGDPESSCSGGSPLTPIRGFGKVWCTVSAVRNGLGGATGGEQGFNGIVQDFQQGAIIRTDAGQNYVLYSGNGWENR